MHYYYLQLFLKLVSCVSNGGKVFYRESIVHSSNKSMVFTIDSEFNQYFYQQFKSRRKSVWILPTVFLFVVVFEVVRFSDTNDRARLIFLSLSFLFFLLIVALFSIFTYWKLTRIVTAYFYEQNSHCWHFTTYVGTTIVTAGDVTEGQGELSFINTRFKCKLFISNGKMLYFPLEKLE